jgi:hypothetical protein
MARVIVYAAVETAISHEDKSVKLWAPEGCVTLSYQGRILAIDEDGSIDVEADAFAALAPHGFVSNPPDGTPQPVESIAQRAEAASASGLADDDRIESMNRPALFAFLKEKGVSVALPVTNEELRALARRAPRA